VAIQIALNLKGDWIASCARNDEGMTISKQKAKIGKLKYIKRIEKKLWIVYNVLLRGLIHSV